MATDWLKIAHFTPLSFAPAAYVPFRISRWS